MVIRGKIKYPNLTIPNFISLSNYILTTAQTYNSTHTTEKISNIIVDNNYIRNFLDFNGTVSSSAVGHKLI